MLAPACPRHGSLQQMLELHAVGDLGECINASEVADALLGEHALADVPRGDHVTALGRVIRRNLAAGVGHRHFFAGGRQQRGFPGPRPRVSQTESRPLAFDHEVADGLSAEVGGCLAEQAFCRRVDARDGAVHARQEYGVTHAGDDLVQVIAGTGGAAEAQAKAIKLLSEAANLRGILAADVGTIVALGQPLDCRAEFLHRAPASSQPGPQLQGRNHQRNQHQQPYRPEGGGCDATVRGQRRAGGCRDHDQG